MIRILKFMDETSQIMVALTNFVIMLTLMQTAFPCNWLGIMVLLT